MNGYEAFCVVVLGLIFIGLLQNIFVSGPQRKRQDKMAMAFANAQWNQQLLEESRDRQFQHQKQPTIMVGPDGIQHPTWCPDCERKF